MGTALQSIQERIKAELATMRESIPTSDSNRISTKGKLFRLPNGRTSQGPISVIILDYRNHNDYYIGAYNPMKPQPPVCFATAKVYSEMAPHPDSPKPQAESCGECVNNQWKSAPTGKGKACRNKVRLAVTYPDLEPGTSPSVHILTVAPTSLSAWAELMTGLEGNDMLPIQIVTEIRFDPNVDYPKLQFKCISKNPRFEEFWPLREAAASALEEEWIDD